MWIAALIGGLLAGASLVWLALRSRLAVLRASLEHERRGFDENLALSQGTNEEFLARLKSLSAEALRSNNASFLELAKGELEKLQIRASGDLDQRQKAVESLVGPIRESLTKVDVKIEVLEQSRRQAYGAVSEQVRLLAEGQERLRLETGNLVTALRAPHVRGRWGEVQLKRVIEATGMIEHCDFVVQSSTRDDAGALLRPDLVVSLPGGKSVVVDAKVPLSAYLDACQAQDDELRQRCIGEHTRQLRDHVAKLAAKAYWRQFEPAPDFVVMFLPDETFLRAALEYDASVNEDAWRSRVILASPTTLLTLLRTVAAVWQQETVAASAREVHSLGRELYERLSTMACHFQQLGKSLTGAIGHYNKTVGALETRVLVTGRKLEGHGIPAELPELSALDVQPRPLTAPELAAAAEVLELPESQAA